MPRLLQPAIPFDGRDKLRHLLQTIAFSLAIAGLHYAFTPDRPFGSAVVYSLAIGIVIWAVIDLGRDYLPSAAETGWPRGLAGIALVAAGVLAGYFLGMQIGRLVSEALGYGADLGLRHRNMDLRSSLLLTAVGGAAVTFYFYAQNRSAYFQRKADEARRHADEARLKLLETQLEPHMLFNTLANLRALIAIDPPQAQQMLDHMIAYLRATLDASRAVTHPLQAEFDRLRDYLELMAIRMGPRLAYTLDLPPGLARVPVPTLLLQPLVENAIRHGLEPQVTGGRIAVHAAAEGAMLVLDVADTGIGIAAGAPAGQGFGLAQIHERLHTLHGTAAALEVLPGHPGTLARIRMPLPEGFPP